MIDALFRILPAFKGKQRIARFLFRSYLKKQQPLIIEGKWGCKYHLPNIIENIGFEIFINGVYEQETIDFIIRWCKNSAVFVDLGANIGAITIPVSKRLQNISIICVEAAPAIYAYLQRNIKENEVKHASLINKAVSVVANKKVPFYSPEDKYGKGSMTPVFTKTEVIVNTTTLGEIVSSVDIAKIGLIKVDVEGHEYSIFLGGEEILQSKDAPDILFEFEDWAEKLAGFKEGSAQDLLKAYGYNLHLLKNGKLEKPLHQCKRKGSAMILATKRKL